MPIPHYIQIMRPVLTFLDDKREHTNQEIYDYVGNFFNLSEAEKTERFEVSGKIKFQNHARWAINKLKRDGLVKQPKRAFVKITSKGTKWLEEKHKHFEDASTQSQALIQKDLMVFYLL